MKLIKQSQPGRMITGFLCCSILFALAGCKTATAKNADVQQQEEKTVCEAAAADAVAETTASVDAPAKKGKRKPVSEVPVEKEPGDGAPPRAQVNEAMENMEFSLGPLVAVPAVAP